jgi:uncharacterized membrane-anchored protein
MKNKTYYIIAFAIVALVQAFVPINMILHREDVLNTGVLYKFKCAPVDPNDPFRGKFVILSFEAERFETTDSSWKVADPVYAILENDAAGFAKINSLQRTAPESGDYISVEIIGIYTDGIRLKLPFDRYYIEESKAKAAEEVYWKNPTTTVAYVYVTDGSPVLSKLMIGEETIEQAAERYMREKEVQ